MAEFRDELKLTHRTEAAFRKEWLAQRGSTLCLLAVAVWLDSALNETGEQMYLSRLDDICIPKSNGRIHKSRASCCDLVIQSEVPCVQGVVFWVIDLSSLWRRDHFPW